MDIPVFVKSGQKSPLFFGEYRIWNGGKIIGLYETVILCNISKSDYKVEFPLGDYITIREGTVEVLEILQEQR